MNDVTFTEEQAEAIRSVLEETEKLVETITQDTLLIKLSFLRIIGYLADHIEKKQ